MAKVGRNRRQDIDWVKVERLYRAGLLSISEISNECGLPTSTISSRARRDGWKRDLTQGVRQLTRTKLIENLAKVYQEGEEKIKGLQDEQIIQEAARTQVEVVRQHQKTLQNGHALTVRMLDELDATTAYKGELQKLISSTVAPARQEALRRAVSLGSRATIMRDLATAARLWVTLERQAFNIVDDRDKTTNDRKLDEMSAEELRKEILDDAKKMGLDLSPKDLDEHVKANGKMH